MTVYVSKVQKLSPTQGMIAGALGGVVQTLVMMLYGLFGNTSFFTLPTLLAALVGMDTSNTGFSLATVIGMMLNIAILTLLGGLYTVVIGRKEGKAIIWSALIFAVVAWAIGYFLILGPTLLGLADEFYAQIGLLTSFSSMLVYGSVLGAYLVRRQQRELVDSY